MSQILYLTNIQIDFGALSLLPQICEQNHIRRPLIVTDMGIKQAGILQKALDILGQSVESASIFDETPSNPTESAVRQASQVYKNNHCDGLIALGGGSSIDCAKGVAIAATHPGPLKTYATIEGGSTKITSAVAPLIAIPTTAGTGSEVARGAIVIVDDGRKLGFHNWLLMPKAAILDPELTLGLPPSLTAATGMDAIAHCMETYMSAAFNPPADGIALDGLERGWKNIEIATQNGTDKQARLNMMSASMQGAMAFQKGLGCVHSLSHSLGGINPKLHHGTLNAVFLPAVIRFNAQAPSVQKNQRMQKMAQVMGLGSFEQPLDAAQAIAQAITSLNRRLNLPVGLAQMGVEASWIDRIIEGAMKDHCHGTNPRIATSQQYHQMILESM
jgi:4-hydroxybutyrate dehydrogenase